LLGFLYSSPEEQAEVIEGIVKVIPVSGDYLAHMVDEVTTARGTLGALAVIGLLWSGTAVFSAVRKGINHAWHIGLPHYFLLERAIDLLMLLGVAAFAFIQVAFTTNVLGLAELASGATGSGAWVVLRLGYELLSLAVVVAALALLYRFVPNTTVAWRDIWPGAVVGATVFQAVRMVFTWLISSFGNLNLVYGSLGALMAVLVWAYLSAMAILLGAQVAYTYRGVFGTHAGEIAIPQQRRSLPDTARRRGVSGVLATIGGWLLPSQRDTR
jgi:membrane protein